MGPSGFLASTTAATANHERLLPVPVSGWQGPAAPAWNTRADCPTEAVQSNLICQRVPKDLEVTGEGAMRFHHSLNPQFGRRRRGLAAGAAVIVLLVSLPAFAADIPIVQGDDLIVGAKLQVSLKPPGTGFTKARAGSSNPQVVQLSDVYEAGGGVWAVDLTVTGVGIAAVAVVWSNPTTSKIIRQYFVVASGVKVEHASRIYITKGDTTDVPVLEAISAYAYVGNNPTPSTAIVSPQLMTFGVKLTGNSVGTSFVAVELSNADTGTRRFEVVIATVIPPGTLPGDE